MSEMEYQLREALLQIADVARAAAEGGGYDDGGGDDEASGGANDQDEMLYCRPMSLPPRLLLKAADVAAKINPVNAPVLGPMQGLGTGFQPTPMALAVMTTKYWGPTPRRLTVSFMETTEAALRRKIVEHMNAWTRTGGISFVETQGTGEVRISRGGGGYWSYLGTDIRLIPLNQQTMNLQGFSMRTSEAEFKRVVRHEAGHTLGMPHEHMRRDLVARIDPQRAYAYFLRQYGWDRQTVDQQVLKSLDERSLLRTPVDQTSIMCYQLPGEITRDRRPIPGGLDINQTDYRFVGEIYPKPSRRTPDRQEPEAETGDSSYSAPDWDPSLDPEV